MGSENNRFVIKLMYCEERSRQCFEDFTYTTTSEILSAIASGVSSEEIYVTFDYCQENTMWLVNDKWFMDAIYEFAYRTNIPLVNITYLGSNVKLRSVFDKWHSIYRPHEDKINIAYKSFGLRSYGKDKITDVYIPDKPNGELRNRKINCLNSNMNLVHRLLILKELYQRELLDTESNIITFHLQKDASPMVDIPCDLRDLCPIQYDVRGNWQDVYDKLLTPSAGHTVNFNVAGNYSNIYDNTYVTVTTETSECYSYGNQFNDILLDAYMSEFHRELFVTEKTFRPMLYWQPQIILNSSGALQHLRDLGFETFGKYWDESYDNEPDGGKRIKMIVDLFEQINNMTTAELHSMYHDMMPILDHNRNHLLTANFTDVTFL